MSYINIQMDNMYVRAREDVEEINKYILRI